VDVRRCPHCETALETPIVCLACGRLLAPADEPTPFDVLGLEPGHDVDAKDLRRRLLRFSRATHPDFFGVEAPEVRALAERNTARLNGAFEVLSDEDARADWLVRHLGGPDENSERSMPQAFLLEVLEWNELLDEAKHSPHDAPPDPRLPALEAELRVKRTAALRTIAGLLDPLPPAGSTKLRDARRELNAIRYLDRTLGEIEALRLDKAATR
jgi:molecular chaperone HscB